jgi:MFS family permease
VRECTLRPREIRALEPEAISALPQPRPFRRDRRTWAAYLLLGLFAYLETALGPAMPFLRAQLGLGYGLASLHFSAFAIGAIGMGLTGERWMRRLGRTRALWGGLAGMIAGGMLVALSPSVIGTIAGTLAMGLFGTLSLLANQAALADLHGEQRTIAFTESNVAATAHAILAPLVIGALATTWLGWQAGILLAVPWALVLSWVFRDVRFAPSAAVAQVAREGSRLPAVFWVLSLVLFLVSAVEWCLAYWGADFLATVVRLPRATAASTMALFFVAMALGRLLGSRLARRHPGPMLLLAALVVALVGFLCFWLGPVPAISLAGLFVAGLGVANLYPLTVAVATGIMPRRIDEATSRLAVAAGTAVLTAPLVVGALSDVAGLRWGIGIVVPLLGVALLGAFGASRSLTTASAAGTGFAEDVISAEAPGQQ